MSFTPSAPKADNRSPFPVRGIATLLVLSLGLFAAALATGRSSDEPIEDGPLPGFEPKEPAEAVETFQTQDGFRVELLAAEPLVLDPVAGAYDEDGRLYVVEMADYPHVEAANDQPFSENTGDPPIGRLRLLIDLDGDGAFDESHVVADRLSWPTGVVPWKGGVFVAATPDIWYIKDTDGDHKADVRERIFTGFRKYNVQAVMNNLLWGLDHRIYGAGASNGGQILPAQGGPDAEPIRLLRSDFRFDPNTKRFELLSGGSRFGNTIDDWGNRFLCNIRIPAQHVVLPARYLARNPWVATPSALHDAADSGDAVVMHRISPPEPWRVLRARRWANVGKAVPRSELAGAGYLTSSSGITVYRGDAYPDRYHGNLFLGEVANNLIHRMTVSPDGVTFRAERADKGVEFVASTDTWFRPVNFVNAPDGTLHVLDMYRETIEHPWSIPDDIRARLDLRSGDDRGRIYRLAPQGFQPRPAPKLSEATILELVDLLEHPNAWHRDTAHRLLFERQDRSAVAPLRRLLEESDVPLGRLHALWSLSGLDALSIEDLQTALSDPSPHVREHAVRLAESRLSDAPELLDRVVSLADDLAPRVRFQVAFSLGEVDAPSATTALAQIGRKDAESPWIRSAVLSSANRDPVALFEAMIGDADGENLDQPGLLDLLESLAFTIGAGSGPIGASTALNRLAQRPGAGDDPVARSTVLGLAGGLRRSSARLSELKTTEAASTMLDRLFDTARRLATAPDAALDRRARAIALLGFQPFDPARLALVPLLGPEHPTEVRHAAVEALTRFGDRSEVAGILLEPWPTYTPAVREAVLQALLGRRPWADALLKAIESGTVTAGQIPTARRSALLRSPDASVRDRAAAIFGDQTSGARSEVTERYQAALERPGDPEAGRAVFDRVCATCHRLGTSGHEVGPNLASVQRRTPGEILVHILDPNREVAPDALEYAIALKDGRVTTGLIASESATGLTLLRAGGESETVLRRDIEEIASTGRSLMPEGMEKDINPEQMADLIAFLLQLQSL